jgi:hypothetical protein
LLFKNQQWIITQKQKQIYIYIYIFKAQCHFYCKMFTLKCPKCTHTHTHTHRHTQTHTHTYIYIYIYIYCLLWSHNIKSKHWKHLTRKIIYTNADERDNTEIITSQIRVLLVKHIFFSDHKNCTYTKCKMWWIYLKMSYIQYSGNFTFFLSIWLLLIHTHSTFIMFT